jgi:hypothetical protein
MYWALDIQISMDSEPLVRTKQKTPRTGERRTLRAEVSYDLSEKAEIVNCFRLMFAMFGINFSVPQAGPITGAEVSWKGREGFIPYDSRIVQFVGGDPEHAATDAEDGTSEIDVEGVGQKYSVPDGATAIDKEATIQLQVQLQHADPYNDLLAAAGTGGNFGDAVQLPVSFIIEMAKRIRWFSQEHFTFNVTDWAADYRIDETVTGSGDGGSWTIRYTGTKCDGPEGEWVIDYQGEVTVPGAGSATIEGTIFVQIPEDALSGKMAGTTRIRAVGQPAGAEGTFGGTGTFHPNGPSMELKSSGGSATGFAYGFSGSGGTGGGTLSLPVEVGLCE